MNAKIKIITINLYVKHQLNKGFNLQTFNVK